MPAHFDPPYGVPTLSRSPLPTLGSRALRPYHGHGTGRRPLGASGGRGGSTSDDHEHGRTLCSAPLLSKPARVESPRFGGRVRAFVVGRYFAGSVRSERGIDGRRQRDDDGGCTRPRQTRRRRSWTRPCRHALRHAYTPTPYDRGHLAQRGTAPFPTAGGHRRRGGSYGGREEQFSPI